MYIFLAPDQKRHKTMSQNITRLSTSNILLGSMRLDCKHLCSMPLIFKRSICICII